MLYISKVPSSFFASHVQPDPNNVEAFVVNSSLNLSKDPKDLSIDSSNSPVGPSEMPKDSK